ncbi:MAG: hypothetical protein COX57_03850 [Alphaproteobacteria bacterium CG_4_10_14_0_2_um_filter_63_37]|nr:MAG: hypothetical protein AUJ55_08360 [Proteobacteria bacterium CG1_02_64_396]PJA25341.1 MAG: hypothetical protein COX57_03850 [Alphaproteobacteria bacterium CG_4_10_14_0_2_um_filter_63_37]
MRPSALPGLLAATLLLTPPAAWGGSSTIVEVDGSACMGDSLSRKQTETQALAETKRAAAESAATYVKSQSTVENAMLTDDLIAAYSAAKVTVIEVLQRGWYNDPMAGDCFGMKIKAEVTPDEAAIAQAAKKGGRNTLDDPTAPLTVKVWTSQEHYQPGEHMQVYLKGNKPFYARVVYQQADGTQVQLLPNSYRSANHFQGGVVYSIPDGEDRFDLEVSPPFGDESVTVYASTAPLGEVATQDAGGVYVVQGNLGVHSRGIKLVGAASGGHGGGNAAEFSEQKARMVSGP